MKNGNTKDQERIPLLQVGTEASMVELIIEVECFLSTVNNFGYLITYTYTSNLVIVHLIGLTWAVTLEYMNSQSHDIASEV